MCMGVVKLLKVVIKSGYSGLFRVIQGYSGLFRVILGCSGLLYVMK